MKIKAFTFNQFQENTYIVYDETKECIIIDPGCYTKEEEEEINNFINIKKLRPVKLINTHCHIDHILGNNYINQKWGLDLYTHILEIPLLKESINIAKTYGFEKYKTSPLPKYFLKEKDLINFGNSEFNILFCPGHSPGHVCLYNQKESILISGDVIFKNSIGRTDLPGGDFTTLITSIKNNILPLSDKTQIFCGHGLNTNLEYERKNNPFINQL
tara:strand:- start:2664 stop:3308 length:645 start_codon:yes stop_codon:yes gene_type:complete